MRVLVTGAGGMLGQDLVNCLRRRDYEVIALPHRELDITDLETVRASVRAHEPELVINCAAYNKVDDAEEEEHQAMTVNGLAVQNLCLACQERDIPLVHFSTDYVFDGTKGSPYTIHDHPNPASAYGRSKLLGERYVLWLLSKFYLIRTSWLFGVHGRNFVETMLDLGQRLEQVPVVNDQHGCPTWTCHLAEAAVELVETGRYGIYHVSNSGPATWYEFAREIFRLSGLAAKAVPVPTEQFPRPAKRPCYSVLDPYPVPQLLGREMPTWREALTGYLSLRKETARL
jgi:dTDP-4-dehydrorhamnose reductase